MCAESGEMQIKNGRREFFEAEKTSAPEGARLTPAKVVYPGVMPEIRLRGSPFVVSPRATNRARIAAAAWRIASALVAYFPFFLGVPRTVKFIGSSRFL